METLLILAMGLSAGLMSGIFGVGGGVVLIPMLVLFLGLEQHLAQGISLLFIIPTALSGLWHLYRQKLVEVNVAVLIAAGSIVGILISGNFVQNIPAAELKKLFGAFVIYSGVRMVLPKKK